MKGKVSLVSKLGLILLVLALTAGAGQAQEPPPPEGEEGMAPQSADAHIFPTMSYQGSLSESGTPVNGARSMTFRLFDVSSGGAAIWTQGPQNVQVRDGVFTANLGGASHFDVDTFDKNLWLEIEVAGTVLPRQRLRGAPYAMTLAPDADITGETDSSHSLLYAYNQGAGNAFHGYAVSKHGIQATSSGSGLGGSALFAKAWNENGIALYALNTHNASTDATIVSKNDGTGDLFKGFGGDGGDDEFRITNDGAILSKAWSYVFIPGNAFVKNISSDTTRWNMTSNGGTDIHRGADAGDKTIYFPITLPAVLYGQAVQIKSIRIYYKCENGADTYIDRTRLRLQTDSDSYVTIVDSQTDRTSNSAADYTITVNETLSSNRGILGLELRLHFVDDLDYIQIGGVRVRLDHHPLY